MLPSLLKSRLTPVALAIGIGLACFLLWPLPAYDDGGPYFLEFGRGSGLMGLDTVKVRLDGTVVLHRLQASVSNPSWEMTTLKLPNDSLAQVRDAVEKNRLLELDKEYHGNVVDGEQWVLLIKERGVYFDNNFPDAIVRFAEMLDKVLAENGLEKAQWRRISSAHAGKHDRALWDSLKR